ncbi:primosomal protein N' [Castellaniella caeni]|uniref:primosomal protein N' n=1 Tax=Castellaniella caeni TaxID=266123 RepID=UPI000836DB92|nr:primosomal protein N' [Castellaniella caeni]
MSDPVYLAVALDVPLPGLFDYAHDVPVAPGVRVRVMFGRRAMIGMVWAVRQQPQVAPDKVRAIESVLDDLPPLPDDWLRLAGFAARYYHHPLGEVVLPALPPSLRKPSAYTGARSAGGPVCRADRRPGGRQPRHAASAPGTVAGAEAAVGSPDAARGQAPQLTAHQQAALARLQTLLSGGHGVALLHGVTGSGKTELYLRLAQQVLAQGRQVLLLVPEINLTPQLEQVVRDRLMPDAAAGAPGLAIMHSRLSEGDRLRAWLRVSRGEASLLLGTRLALMTPMPRLGLIVVDEEHDASYKQQDGLRYSARDLAIWRGHDLGIPVVLGSATPSLETWRHAQEGDYQYVSLPERAQTQPLPDIRLVDTRRAQLEQGFTPQLLQALEARLRQGEQSLVFINRRGYAPVLRCPSCGWVSQCRQCTAHTVVHRASGRRAVLQCHHCGDTQPVPRACPDCGDQDLQPMGRGTQRVEEFLAEHFPQARIVRIDADATRRKGSAEALFAQVHAGEADILVGTQMVSKGHDFAGLGLVGVLNADAALFAQDFRAPERLFAQLMQVAGRAGRRAAGAQVLVQTDYPDQAVYQALCRHDYSGFAQASLAERQDLGLPPFSSQALLTAQAPRLADALDFLLAVRDCAASLPEAAGVRLYDAVPLRVVRVARVERAQLLLESTRRPALHRLLNALLPRLDALAGSAALRWGIEVDPQDI